MKITSNNTNLSTSPQYNLFYGGEISFQDLFLLLISSLNDLGNKKQDTILQNASLGQINASIQEISNKPLENTFLLKGENINGKTVEEEPLKSLPLNPLNQGDSQVEDISASVWNAFLLFLRAVIVSSMDIQNAKVANQNSKVDTEPNSQGTSSTINGNFFQNLAYIQFFPEGSLSTERFLATQSLQETTLAVGKITTLLRESLDSYANSRNPSQEEKNLLAHLSQKLEERLQTFNMVNEEGTSFLNAARDSFLKFLEEKVFEVPERNPKNSLIKEEPLAKEAFSLKSLGEKFNHLQDETKIDIANKIASLNKEFPLDEVLKKDFSQKYEKEPIHSKTNLSNHFEWAINFVSPTEKSIFKNSQAFSQNKELVKIENLTQFIKNFTIELKPSGERSALLELEPPELGKMEVTVKLKESEVEIVAKVEKAETLAHLKQEFLQIKTELENLGLKLKDFQLSLGLSGDERSFGERNGERREERKEKVNRAATEGLGETPTLLYRGRLYKIV